MLPLYDNAALRVIEARAVRLLGGDAFELMRRAGRVAWRCALRNWPQARRVLVVCGPGNNGGDGYVLAKHALDSGREARVVRLDAHAPRGELARRALEEYRARGGQVEVFAGTLPPADLLVDALFGIGFAPAHEPAAQGLIEAMRAHRAPCLALDVPSGIDAATGAVPGPSVRATRTLEFIAAKPGLASGPAVEHAGVVEVADLDVPAPAFDGIAPKAEIARPEQLREWLRPRRRDAHKGEFGRVLCIGGDHGGGGAIGMCGEAALRCGAGLVEVLTREAHVPALLARRPELMVRAAERAEDVAAPLQRADVVALGPGLGQELWGRVLFKTALAAGKPTVLDADGLNLLAARKTGRALPHAVLTPHPGEAARLLSVTLGQVQSDRFGAARALADRHGAVVVLKGAGSIVAAPERTPRTVAVGNPGMATGGMGDLLTGVIAALLAQGLEPFDAATAGVLLHGIAGDAGARNGGERGLLPSDLLPFLRRFANPELLK